MEHRQLHAHIDKSKVNYYPTEINGLIEIDLPSLDNKYRLLVFNPVEFPHLWDQYCDGLTKSHKDNDAEEAFDNDLLKEPNTTSIAAIVAKGSHIVAGIRANQLIIFPEEAVALKEMAKADTTKLQRLLTELMPEKIVEVRGQWIDKDYVEEDAVVKELTCIASRMGVLFAGLLNSRYSIATAAEDTIHYHQHAGFKVVKKIGRVTLPSSQYQTAFIYADFNNLAADANKEQYIMIQKEWELLSSARTRTPSIKHQHHTKTLILDEDNPFHYAILNRLKQDDEIEKHNHVESMRKELSNLLPPAPESIKNEPSRWVYYPWRRSMVRIVGPKAYKRIRHDRNRNKITFEEQAVLGAFAVGVIGLSAGHVIAHTLAMEGLCGHIRLTDFDNVELSNLNRIPGSLFDIDKNKAVFAAQRIAELDPYLKVDIHEGGLTADSIDKFLKGLDVVIEECDSLDLKLLVREAAARKGIPVMMATSDMGLLDIERFDHDMKRRPFHGLVNVKAEELSGLSTQDKAAHALAILEGKNLSPRLLASMVDIDHGVTTWPQLGSDVILGAAMVAIAVRRLGTQKELPSGRVRFDLEEMIATPEDPIPELSISSLAFQPEANFSGDIKADILTAAKQAPSPGNIQPWRMYWKEDQFAIEINRELTTRMDIKWRGAMTALGAATFNAMAVAAEHYRLGNIVLEPNVKNPDLMVSMNLGDKGNDDFASTVPYLFTRHTNRKIGQSETLPVELLEHFRLLVEAYDADIRFLTKREDLDRYTDLAAESDRLRYIIDNLHSEMVDELVWPGQDSLDQGIDVRTLELDSTEQSSLPVMCRGDVMKELYRWNSGQALGDYTRDRMKEASALAVITIKGERNADYIKGGIAAQRFWLEAEKQEVAVQPISPIVIYANSLEETYELVDEVDVKRVYNLRERFNRIIGLDKGENPVLVVRLTQADRPEVRSARRS